MILNIDVIYDENKLTADSLQRLINTQSYTFARSNKAVSLRIPLPVLADL